MGLIVNSRELDRLFRDYDSLPVRDALLADIGNELAEASRLCFVDGTDPWGNAWEALGGDRPGGIGRSGKPLRDTGRLMNSITYRASPAKVEVGTDFAYGGVHQFGATIKPTKPNGRLVFTPRGFTHPVFAREVEVPARPFLPIDENGDVDLPEDQERDVAEIIEHYLTGLGS